MKPFLLAALVLVAACAPRSAVAPMVRSFPDKLKALGTEPFWSLAIDGGAVAYSTAERPTPVTASVARIEQGDGLELAGTIGGRPINVRVVPETCSDGMSDRSYPYAVTVAIGTERLRGCAHPAQTTP